jgi:hypothetical protein
MWYAPPPTLRSAPRAARAAPRAAPRATLVSLRAARRAQWVVQSPCLVDAGPLTAVRCLPLPPSLAYTYPPLDRAGL